MRSICALYFIDLKNGVHSSAQTQHTRNNRHCRLSLPFSLSDLVCFLLLATFGWKVNIFCWQQNAAAGKATRGPESGGGVVCGCRHTRIAVRQKVWSPPAGLCEEVMTSSSSLCWRYGSALLWTNQSRTLERMPPWQMVQNLERGTEWCWSEECLLPRPLFHATMQKAGLLSMVLSIFANFIEKTSAIAHDMIIWVKVELT